MREGTDGVKEGIDDMRESGYKLKETDMLPIKPPKQVARITICGCFHLEIFDNIEFFAHFNLTHKKILYALA